MSGEVSSDYRRDVRVRICIVQKRRPENDKERKRCRSQRNEPLPSQDHPEKDAKQERQGDRMQDIAPEDRKDLLVVHVQDFPQ